MPQPSLRRSPDLPASALHTRAMADLRFIRQTMERAGAFTAVPGWGAVLMGLTTLPAAWLAARQHDPHAWTLTWLADALLALGIGAWTMSHKARREGRALLRGPGRRFALSFLPPLLCGALLTPILLQHGLAEELPGLWLLLYGTGVVTGGAYSVRIVPVMGLAFMACGLLALLLPPPWGNTCMIAGFGGLHVLFGAVIAWRHGG